MNETKVNTNIGGVASPESKKHLLPPDCVGSIQTPFGVQHVNRGDAVDHAYMRSTQLTSLLLLIQGEAEGERYLDTFNKRTQESILWLAVQLAQEMEEMVDIIAEDVRAEFGGTP